MSELLAKVAIAMLTKLITESFFSKVVYYSVKAWSDQSANKWDDKVVQAMGEALSVETK